MSDRIRNMPARPAVPIAASVSAQVIGRLPAEATGTLGHRTVAAAPAARRRSIGQTLRAWVRRLAALPVWIARCVLPSRVSPASTNATTVVTQPSRDALRTNFAARIGPMIRRAIASTRMSPAKGDAAFDAMLSDAVAFLRENGLEKKEAARLAPALIRETTTEMVDRDPLFGADLDRLIGLISRGRLSALYASKDGTVFCAQGDDFAFTSCVTGQIGLRLEQSEEAFLSAARKIDDVLPRSQKVAALETYIRRVVALGALHADHLADCAMTKEIEQSRVFKEGVTAVRARLHADFDQHVGAYLDLLDSDTLTRFASALDALQVPHAPKMVRQAADAARQVGA